MATKLRTALLRTTLLIMFSSIAACSSVPSVFINLEGCAQNWNRYSEAQLTEASAGVYYGYGIGESLEEASLQARSSIASQIETSISTQCTDTERYDTEARMHQHQECITRSSSKARVYQVSVVDRRQCGDQFYVTSKWDSRSLVKRIDLSGLGLTSQVLKDVSLTDKIPYWFFVAQRGSPSIGLSFSYEEKLWAVTVRGNQIRIPQKVLWSGLSWDSCLGGGGFSLDIAGTKERLVSENDLLDVRVEGDKLSKYITLMRVLPSGEANLVGRDIQIKEATEQILGSIKAILKPGERSSEHSYIAIFSEEPLEYWGVSYAQAAEQSMDAVFDLMSLSTVSSVCAVPLVVERASH